MRSLIKTLKTSPLAWGIVLFWLLMAVFSPIIATDQPLYAKWNNENHFPAFKLWVNDQAFFKNPKGDTIKYSNVDWKFEKPEKVIWAIIPYSTQSQDKLNNDYTGPFDNQIYIDAAGKPISMPLRHRHWLGTTQLGQDVLAGLIHGAAMVFKVAFLAIIIASFIGILAGSVAGYFGDDGFKTNRLTAILTLIGFVLGYFWAFESRLDILQNNIDDLFAFSIALLVSMLIWISATIIFYSIGKVIAGRWSNQKITAVPVDLIISRIIEIFHSIPRLLMIISFSALFENRSLTAVVVMIGCTAWTGIARYMRAEMLKVRNMDYINAAKVLRFPTWKIILKHALPNAFGPVAIEIIFALASAIMLESVLSFLSIGVPDDALTWGTLLNYGRQQFDAWWLVLFPGLAIASLVWSLSNIAEKRKALI